MVEQMSPGGLPFRHGKLGPCESGYRKGCRCEGCRQAKRDANAAYRAKKKLQDATEVPLASAGDAGGQLSLMALSWKLPAGEVETALSAELAKLIGEPPFKKTLTVLAKYNAKVLDQIPQWERPDLISGIQSRLFNVFDRLRKVQESAAGAAELDLSALLGPAPAQAVSTGPSDPGDDGPWAE